MNQGCRRQSLHDVNNQLHVLIHGHDANFIFKVQITQQRIIQHVKQVEFDTLDVQICQRIRSCQHIGMAFAGQPENHMGTDPQPARPSLATGGGKGGKIMTASQPRQSPIVAALQAEFQPEIGSLVVFRQHVEDPDRNTVGSCADRKPHDVIDRQGFVIQRSEPVHRGKCVREWLEVSHELACLVFPSHDFLAQFQLSGNTQLSLDTNRSRPPRVTVETASAGSTAIAVGAAEPGIHGDFVYPDSKALFKVFRKHLIWLAGHVMDYATLIRVEQEDKV